MNTLERIVFVRGQNKTEKKNCIVRDYKHFVESWSKI